MHQDYLAYEILTAPKCCWVDCNVSTEITSTLLSDAQAFICATFLSNGVVSPAGPKSLNSMRIDTHYSVFDLRGAHAIFIVERRSPCSQIFTISPA